MEENFTDFETKVYQHRKENEFTTLFEALSDYCQLFDVDYDSLMTTVKFSDVFLTEIKNDCAALNLIKKTVDETIDQLDMF